jgi:hypothetical protein
VGTLAASNEGRGSARGKANEMSQATPSGRKSISSVLIVVQKLFEGGSFGTGVGQDSLS